MGFQFILKKGTISVEENNIHNNREVCFTDSTYILDQVRHTASNNW